MPRCNCGSSKPEAEGGADLKFEFEFKKKPQSVDRTKRPRSCVGSEPGDALKGHRVDSVALLQGDGGLGRKNNRGATNAVLRERRAQYILDDSKRFGLQGDQPKFNPRKIAGQLLTCDHTLLLLLTFPPTLVPR